MTILTGSMVCNQTAQQEAKLLKIPGSTQIAVRLDGEMVAAIDRYAKRFKATRSDAIRELLGVGLKEFRLLETREDIKLMRIASHLSGGPVELQDIVVPTPPANEV